MKIIVINNRGNSKPLRVISPLSLFFMLLILAIPTFVGYVIGYKQAESWPEYFEKLSVAVSESSMQQLHEVANLEQTVADRFDYLNISIAKLQSEIVRMKAMAEKIIDISDINLEEFDFSLEVPIGGEDDISIPISIENQEENIIKNVYITKSQIADQLIQLQLLNEVLVGKSDKQQRKVKGFPTEIGWVSSDYGMRKDPFTGKIAFHRGIDIAGKEDSAVETIAKGVVVRVAQQKGYGYVVDIDHGDGYKTRYAHNAAVLVSQGEVVAKGQQIATIGSTGRSTGPHIHLEVIKNGRRVDPLEYIHRSFR